MSTHAARADYSARLRRVLHVLADGAEYTTLDLMQQAHVCAVNAIVSELRENGYRITCQRRGDRWYYQMDVAAQEPKRA